MANTSFNALRCKEVVNIKDGCRLGYIDDIIFDSETGTICGIQIPDRSRFFGLFSRGEIIFIPWNAIERIGDDIIIVSWDIIRKKPEKIGFLEAISKWLNQWTQFSKKRTEIQMRKIKIAVISILLLSVVPKS